MSQLLERQHFAAKMSPFCVIGIFAMKILCIQLSPHVLPALVRGLSNSVGPLILAQDRHWCLNSVLNVKAVVAAFNHEKVLVGAFSVIVQLH